MLHLATFLAMRRHLTALLVAGLLLGACGDDDDNGDQTAVTSIPDETSTSTSSTTTEPRTVAPDVIPQDESQITEEYVEQVLNELFVVSLNALATLDPRGLVDESDIELIESAQPRDRSRREQINDLVELAFGGFEGDDRTCRPRPQVLGSLGGAVRLHFRRDPN